MKKQDMKDLLKESVIKRAAIRGGMKKIVKKSSLKGFKIVKGKEKKMSSQEMMKRKMSANKSKMKRKAKSSSANIKRKRSMQKRKNMGIR